MLESSLIHIHDRTAVGVHNIESGRTWYVRNVHLVPGHHRHPDAFCGEVEHTNTTVCDDCAIRARGGGFFFREQTRRCVVQQVQVCQHNKNTPPDTVEGRMK